MFLPWHTIQTLTQIDRAHIFRIISTGTRGVLGTWRFLRDLELQRDGGTTLTDDAAGE